MGDIADWMVDQALRFWPRDPGAREQKWTTADGTRIRVRDMGNGHLLNTIRLLERRGYGFPDCDGDDKGNFTDPFEDYADFDPPDIYHDMVAEAHRRGLDLSLPGYAADRIATPDEFPYVES